MKSHNPLLFKSNNLMTFVFGLILSWAFINPAAADVLDDASTDDINQLCNSGPANALYKIANKKNNPDQLRRDALERMMEVSRECATSGSDKLAQFHKKMNNAAFKILELPDIESRQVAVESLQYVILQPDENQPTDSCICQGHKLADVALEDSDESIRLWALEALVTIRGDKKMVKETLIQATTDSATIVQETARNMLNDMF